MRVMSGIKEADVGAMEGAVGEQKMTIIGSAGHGAVVCMSEGDLAGTIICFGQSTKQDGIGSKVEQNRLGGGERRSLGGDGDGDGLDGRGLEACFEVHGGSGDGA
jgi:hypothetical protein